MPKQFFSVYVLIFFQGLSKAYTIINFLFASLKSLTNFENAYYLIPSQHSLLCDWPMISIADLLLAAGKLVAGGIRSL
jgi:hypothetical protein